jgi:hypothetical protein
MGKVLEFPTDTPEEKEARQQQQQPLKVAVLVPSRGITHIGFAMDLANMIGFSHQHLVAPGYVQMGLVVGQHTYIDQNRNDLSGAALMADATHALWLDDDMRFPKDLLPRLLTHQVDIVGVNYSTRRAEEGLQPVTIKHIGDDPTNPAERCYTRPESTGLERVDALGFGGVLIRTEVFGTVGHPWFEQFFQHDQNRWMGEDVDFCIKAKAGGHDIWVDHDLSKEIRHIGMFEYKMEHALAYEETSNGDNDIQRASDGDSELAGQVGPDQPDS